MQTSDEVRPAPSAADVVVPVLPQRRHDIDWLRVLAMLGVFVFHNARFFDTLPWHVKNAQHSLAPLVFVGFLNCFQMPLLMLVSGAGAWFSLRSRGAGQYLRERVMRLLVPLYGVGFLVLIPPQYYWEQLTNHGYGGSFRSLYSTFLKTLNFDFGLGFLSFWPGHLWFLRDLFLISLLTLPVLLGLRSEWGRRAIARLAAWCYRPGGMFLLVIPIVLIQIGLRAVWPGGHPLIWFFYLLTYFLAGYLIVAEHRFVDAIRRNLLVGLIVGIGGFAILAGWVLGLGFEPSKVRRFTLELALFYVVDVVHAWGWIVFLLGLSSRCLNFSNRVLVYCNEAVMPFYVLHQTVLLAIGWYVVRWNIGMAAKFVIISVLSFAAIMASYELIIRRVGVVRVLFGMKGVSAAPTTPEGDLWAAAVSRHPAATGRSG